MTRPIVVIAHHEETCGGLVLEWMRRIGSVQVVRPLLGQPLPEHHEIGGVVLLGSHHGVYENVPGLATERRWVEQAMCEELPVFGICFGAQLLAQIAGAPVRPASAPERGIHSVNLVCPLTQALEPIEVMQWHQDCITRLPVGGQWLAKGTGEHEVQGFTFGSAAGVQFHPEVTESMLERWSSLPSAPVDCLSWQEKLAKLGHMRSWVVRFLVNHFSMGCETFQQMPLPLPVFAGTLR